MNNYSSNDRALGAYSATRMNGTSHRAPAPPVGEPVVEDTDLPEDNPGAAQPVAADAVVVTATKTKTKE